MLLILLCILLWLVAGMIGSLMFGYHLIHNGTFDNWDNEDTIYATGFSFLGPCILIFGIIVCTINFVVEKMRKP